MTVNLQFDAEVERKLQEAAAMTNMTVEAYIQRLVEQCSGVVPKKHMLPPEEWIAEFKAWVASHEALPTIADDDRESIYAGRGE